MELKITSDIFWFVSNVIRLISSIKSFNTKVTTEFYKYEKGLA